MSRQWPIETIFHDIILDNELDRCPLCRAKMYICDHRHHRIYSLASPLRLICKLVHCSNKYCPNHKQTFSPEKEQEWALPGWKIGWDVFVWIGYRRFKRHWSVEQIRNELLEGHSIALSDDAIEDYILKYQAIVTARQSDFKQLKKEYKDCNKGILTIDGLQPEKGHEVLYVVREIKQGRLWFAEALVSSSASEIKRIILQAKDWANKIGLTIEAWVSDKQDAFVTTIAEVFPGVPHRYCKNHFLRDIAEETLRIDGEAKMQMRKKVRGLKLIENDFFETIKSIEKKFSKDSKEYKQAIKSAEIITSFCSVIKGILNDNDNGPLDPPGLRMVNALQEVHKAINKLLKTKKEGNICSQLIRLVKCIDRGLEHYESKRAVILNYLREIKRINQTLISKKAPCKQRLRSFNKIYERLKKSDDSIKQNMASFMSRFSVGLFSGGDNLDIPEDNQDLERWFKTPKGHERRINGHKHAGTRIVYEGPILLPTLDAHKTRAFQFTPEELIPYAEAQIPTSQLSAISRRRLMKRGASKKKAWEQ